MATDPKLTAAQQAEAAKLQPSTERVKVKMLVDGTHKDGTKLEAGKTYSLPADSAHMWLNRRHAERTDGAPDPKDAPVAGPKGDGTVTLSAAEVADREKALGLQGGNVNDQKPGGEQIDSADMTVAQLKEALDAGGGEYESGALKDDLVKAHKKMMKKAAGG